jgi:hypothetical protein
MGGAALPGGGGGGMGADDGAAEEAAMAELAVQLEAEREHLRALEAGDAAAAAAEALRGQNPLVALLRSMLPWVNVGAPPAGAGAGEGAAGGAGGGNAAGGGAEDGEVDSEPEEEEEEEIQ